MEIVTIEKANYDVLRQTAEKIQFPLSEEVRQFINEMYEFIQQLQHRVGLAAPQVGKSWQIVFIQVPQEALKLRQDANEELPLTLLINPSYRPIEERGKNKDWEGCFSVPDMMGEVYRYNSINFEAYTINGEKISNTAHGFIARILQHEIGHLNGELYIDLIEEDCRYGPMKKMREIRIREMEEQSLEALD